MLCYFNHGKKHATPPRSKRRKTTTAVMQTRAFLMIHSPNFHLTLASFQVKTEFYTVTATKYTEQFSND